MMVQVAMLTWVSQTLELVDEVNGKMLQIVMSHWFQGAQRCKLLRSLIEQREVGRVMALVFTTEAGAVIDSSLLRKAAISWNIAASLERCARQKEQSIKRRCAWVSTSDRLRRCIRASTRLLEKEEYLALSFRVFLEWRKFYSINSVERTGKEVRIALDERIVGGRRKLQRHKDILDKAFAICHWQARGPTFTAEIVARLVIPAWWFWTKCEQRRQSTLIGEEKQLLKLEDLQGQAANYCLRWSRWACVGILYGLDCRIAESALRAWHLSLCASKMERRRERRARGFVVASDKVLTTTRRLRWRAFSGWHRVQCQQAREALESRLREMEDLFIRRRGEGDRGVAISELAELSDESSSSNDESGSDDDGHNFSFFGPGASARSQGRSTSQSVEPLPDASESRGPEPVLPEKETMLARAKEALMESSPLFQAVDVLTALAEGGPEPQLSKANGQMNGQASASSSLTVSLSAPSDAVNDVSLAPLATTTPPTMPATPDTGPRLDAVLQSNASKPSWLVAQEALNATVTQPSISAALAKEQKKNAQQSLLYASRQGAFPYPWAQRPVSLAQWATSSSRPDAVITSTSEGRLDTLSAQLGSVRSGAQPLELPATTTGFIGVLPAGYAARQALAGPWP
jgi:hypothetical protein